MFDADILQEFFRADACPLFKQALKMEGAQMNLPGHFIQVWLRLKIFANIADSFFYCIIMYVHTVKVEPGGLHADLILADLKNI